MAVHQTTADTERIARSYFDAWTSKNTTMAASVLAEEFTFTAGDLRIEGREAFLDAGAFPEDAATVMLAEAYQGENGFQMYDATSGRGSVRIVEHLVVRHQSIQSSTFVTNMTEFMQLMGDGRS
jgi:hypothetical protein